MAMMYSFPIGQPSHSLGVMPHCKKTADRTFKHIWFLPTHKAKTKNQKSLNFCQSSTNKK